MSMTTRAHCSARSGWRAISLTERVSMRPKVVAMAAPDDVDILPLTLARTHTKRTHTAPAKAGLQHGCDPLLGCLRRRFGANDSRGQDAANIWREVQRLRTKTYERWRRSRRRSRES